MSAHLELDGMRVVSGTLTMPLYGTWSADLALATAAPIAEHATVKLGNLLLSGTVIRQMSSAGSRTARIVGGAGGWRKTLRTKARACSRS